MASFESVAVVREARQTVYPHRQSLNATRGAELNRRVTRKDLARFSLVSIAILSLSVTGCRLIGGGESPETPVAPTSRPGVVRNVATVPGPTQQTPKSSVTMATAPQRAPEVKHPPAATTTKGAEKLVAQSSPALPHTKETISPANEARPASSSSSVGAVSKAAVGSNAGGPASPVKELIVKGPPRVRQVQSDGRNGHLWMGLGFGCAVVALGALIFLQRRPRSSAPGRTDKEDLVMPKEFLLKEPAPTPKWSMTAD